MANEVELPKCKYGDKCYRINPDHLLQFWHPSRSESISEELAPRLNKSPADSRLEDRKGVSELTEQGRDLKPQAAEDIQDDAVEGEWEIDDYNEEVVASSESDGVEHETSPSSNSEPSRTGSSQSVDAAVLLLLVGVPGSGKSTFCSELMSNAAQPWSRICQDIISNGKRGTKQQCLRQAESALLRRRSVVIDRCNIDMKQREDFLQLAARLKVNCHAVVLNLPPRLCIERASKRLAHEGGVHAGNAAPLINRVNRSRQLPSLSEGFFRISFCRTDADVERAVQEYRVLHPSKLLEPGVFGHVNKSESKALGDRGSSQLAASNPSSKKSSPPPGSKKEVASVQAGLGKPQVPVDYSCGEGLAGRSGTTSSVTQQHPGANTLAFPSISTADFQFDHDKASTVLVESISDFQLKYQHTGLKLVLVDLSSKSHMFSLVKRKASEKGLDLNRFITYSGDITKIQSSGGPPCNIIANAANWRLRPGGGGVNAAIYKAAGPELEQATKKVATTLLPGTSIVVPVPSSSPLRNEEGVTHVIHVLGPNMNPQRPNLVSDYVEGCKTLRHAYASLFENFASVSQAKPKIVDNGKRAIGAGSVNQKPRLNAFEVLMQATKRKGEVADTALKREKGEKVRIVEDGIAGLHGDETEGGLTQRHGQPNLPFEAGHQGFVSRSIGEKELQHNTSNGQQVRKKVERTWHNWALPLYKYALHPDGNRSELLEVTDFAVVLNDKYPKARKHVLIVARTQGLDTLEDVRTEHVALLERLHSLGMKHATSFLKDDPSLVFRLGYHSVHNMPLKLELLRGMAFLLKDFHILPNKRVLSCVPSFMDGSFTRLFYFTSLMQVGYQISAVTSGKLDPLVQVPSMRQLHLHVISQDFDSAGLKNKKHWNSFTSPFFRDSQDVIHELRTHGQVDDCGPSAEKLLEELELRCHRCRSVQPNIPRLKTHVSLCTRPQSNSSHLITANSVNGQ